MMPGQFRSIGACSTRLAAQGETRMTMSALVFAAALAAGASPAAAAEVKVLTAGAFKQVLLALLPELEKQAGGKVTLDNDTVGALTKRIEGGESFDLAVLTPAALENLTGKGKIAPATSTKLARV